MCIDFDLLLPRSSVWATHYVQGMWNLYSRNHFFSPLSAGVFPRLLSSFPCSLPLGDATRCLDVCYAVWPLLGKWCPKSWICPNPLKFDMSPTGLNILPSFQTHFTTRWLGQKSYHLQLPAPPSLIIDHLNSSIYALRCLQNWSPKQCPLPVSTLPLHDLFAMLKQSDVFLKCKSYYSPAWNSFIHLTCLLQISYNTLCSFAATDFLPTSPDNTVRPLHSSNNNSIVISPATPYSSFSLGIFTRCSFKTLSTFSQDCP